MIWHEELSASLDQSAGVVVFHRVELTRTQQLAQVLADKVSAMVEQNEKILDNKLGGSTGWGDRGEGGKGDKREQVQERKGRTGGRGGTSRGRNTSNILSRFADGNLGRGRGGRFQQGLGNQMNEVKVR